MVKKTLKINLLTLVGGALISIVAVDYIAQFHLSPIILFLTGLVIFIFGQK